MLERQRSRVIISAELKGSLPGFPDYDKPLRGQRKNTEQTEWKRSFTLKSHSLRCPHRLPIAQAESACVVPGRFRANGSGQDCHDAAGSGAYKV